MDASLRLIRTAPLDAYMNMALDEALFISSVSSGAPVITARLYEWNPAAFSFGVSQKIEEVLGNIGLRNTDCVRRMTGGGIMFHDDEITYSLIAPDGALFPRRPVAESFKVLCAFLIRFYESLGLKPRFAVDEPYKGKFGAHAAFCSAGREKYDILIGSKKIGGNAQKRVRGHIFQHGSIPMAALKGHLGAVPPREYLFGEIARSLEEAFAMPLGVQDPTAEEWGLAARLKEEKYQTKTWNSQRIESRPGLTNGYRLATAQR